MQPDENRNITLPQESLPHQSIQVPVELAPRSRAKTEQANEMAASRPSPSAPSLLAQGSIVRGRRDGWMTIETEKTCCVWFGECRANECGVCSCFTFLMLPFSFCFVLRITKPFPKLCYSPAEAVVPHWHGSATRASSLATRPEGQGHHLKVPGGQFQ
ncbi:hypothetical protein MAPG_05688 [Magnaporthiopsis poae ATCC 64411]|uniref:Uncharacterized protein n=1 Tax=Magnaporthiopsis poae (strain ATCC 64411 / 73-15) TaxID=644358 RepID=A0A0C4E022_MAGP6|nr:hypothetical protein MAPG_05688 [Magnaporthiopsis poae ATCC 64411]